jgi:hypothetical protein
VQFNDSDRLKTRLLAINIRLAELDHEMRQTQIRVNHLESELENARLAAMMGENAGDLEQIRPELERSRGSLETQRAFLEQVKGSRMEVQKAWARARVKERQEALAREHPTSSP